MGRLQYGTVVYCPFSPELCPHPLTSPGHQKGGSLTSEDLQQPSNLCLPVQRCVHVLAVLLMADSVSTCCLCVHMSRSLTPNVTSCRRPQVHLRQKPSVGKCLGITLNLLLRCTLGLHGHTARVALFQLPQARVFTPTLKTKQEVEYRPRSCTVSGQLQQFV